MEISRDDVRFDEIIETGNFIKLPIKPYLDLLGIKTKPAQHAIINAINNSQYRFVVAAVSRRQGKTFIANIVGQLITLMPFSNVLIMAPNYSLAQISFDLQRSFIKHFDLEMVKDNAKDRIIELSNGSTIRMGSVNQVDSVVGRSYDLIIFDEAALADGEDAFNVQLRPTLDKPNSKAIFISTPRGKRNWFAKFWQRGWSDQFPAWCSIRATYLDNPTEDPDNILEAQKSMSDAEFRQEFLCDFNVFEGQIWRFNSSKCIADLSGFEITHHMDVIAGLDVGFRDPTAYCVIVYNWDDEKYYILKDYLNSERTTEQHAVEILKINEKYNPDFIFIDSAAQQVKMDLAMEYGISTNNAIKDVLAGIGHVSSLVENDRIIVDQNCNHVLATMDQYQWDANPNLLREKPKHNEFSHMADAIRYAIYSFQTSSGVF